MNLYQTPSRVTHNNPATHPEELYTRLKNYIDQIQPGMQRTEVEQLLHQPLGGIQGEKVTIYHLLSGVKVEIPFDSLSGYFKPTNRVSGKPQLFVSFPL